jgi:polar amino acid transport system permease protein
VTDGEAATTTSAPARLVAIPLRHWGRWVSALIVVSLLGGLVYAFAKANLHYDTTQHFLTFRTIVTGARNTLVLSLAAQAIGIVLGVVVAVMRQSPNPVMNAVAWLYIWIFRGTPVYLQLLLWFNLAAIFPTIGIPGLFGADTNRVMTPFVAALLGLGINEGAYMAEIVRAGLAAVDEGQTEAAQALGMSRGLLLRRIVLPQAMRVIIPPTGNEFINMLKTSSLATVTTYPELLRAAQNVASNNLQIVEMLFVAALWYLLLTSVFSIGQYYLERRFSRGAARELPPTPWQRVRANLRSGVRV